MTNHEAHSEGGAALRQCVDDLATQWILGGEERLPAIAETLARLSRQAAELGFQDAAHLAEELCAALDATHAADSGVTDMEGFREGLARLEQALACPPGNAAPESGASEASRKSEESEPPSAINSLAQDPELVGDFILESREHLSSIEQLVLTLERAPDDTEAIHSIFRGFHTIKGLAGFLEFVPIQELTHEVETALNLAREGKLAVTTAVIDVILEGVDHVGRSIAGIEAGQACVRHSGHEQLIGRVRALMTDGPPPAAAPPSESANTPEAGTQPDSPSQPDSPNQAKPPDEAAETPKPGPLAAESSEAAAEGAPVRGTAPRRAAAEVPSVRVETAKLDYLVDMVGEMVIAQSLVRHSGALATLSDPRLHRNLSQLARITGEVQRTAMAMRMVPIGQLFQRASRQVRDLSRKIGKRVELVMRGEETELDKSIAEELADPLMHMVRNAIDHGIETPEQRVLSGKAPAAQITLAAYHQGGQIVIEIADDGRGLNAARILAKAQEKGLAEPNAHLSDSEIYRLILEPGFSTAEQVTNISGRGVGMDVVRKQIEKLRGRIEIHSRPGEGTTFLLHLPLTLAIIDGLVVAIGVERYIVPLFAVTEMFRPADTSIFTVRGRDEMVMVRGRLLPLLRLYRIFNVKPRTENPCQALLIVAETDGQQFCLMADELIGKQEVVIKSLGEALGTVRGVAGGAILGDGRVGLILDMGGVWGAYAGN